jgi:putative toxin-antitoxin system antitoxin component (TIGR02293 family)
MIETQEHSLMSRISFDGERWDLIGIDACAEAWGDIIRKGMPVEFFNTLSATCGITPIKLAHLIGVKDAARRRWNQSGRMHVAEGDRLLQIAVVLKACLALFEHDTERAMRWLGEPELALNRRRPLDFFSTFVGLRIVEGLIWRLENGVLS